MSYLQQYDSLAHDPDAQVALVSGWIRTDARPFFAELRAERPILVTKNFTMVSRFPDVTEVLSRERDFTVDLYRPKMDPVVHGPFMLSRDATPVNWREKGIMQAVLRPEDLPVVRELVGQLADEALDAAADEGRIDAVNRLGRYVPIRLCGAYFGFPGPDLATMFRWSRATQTDMFKNLENDPDVHAEAVEAGREMRTYLRALLAEKRAAHNGSPDHPWPLSLVAAVVASLRRHLIGLTGRAAPDGQAGGASPAATTNTQSETASATDDVFGRLIRTHFPKELGFDDQRILSNVAGLLIGAGETTSQAIVQALRQLLLRDDLQEAATSAARTGDAAQFDPYVWEALRLDPINPLIFRLADRDSVIAEGTERETAIPEGTLVFALTSSAMSDEAILDDPDSFRLDRPDFIQLHFGYGHHACLGRYVGTVMIPEVIRRVLLRPDVGLLPSPEGDLDFEGGPFPERFVIRLGLGRATEPTVVGAVT